MLLWKGAQNIVTVEDRALSIITQKIINLSHVLVIDIVASDGQKN